MTQAFFSENISLQDRYKLTGLINGVDGGDSVAMRQLTPLTQDIQTLFNSLSNYIPTASFANLFNQARTGANLQDQAQVAAAIAAALQGLPEPESRLASVACKTQYQGTIAALTAATIAGFGLTASDDGNIDDASTSCVLIDSPIAGETGLYQLKTNGQLQKLNQALFGANMGYYTRFYVIDSSREFAIRQLDAATNAVEVEEIPYTDEFTGLGPIVVSNLNKTINLKFKATDFVLDGDGLNLHPAFRDAIDLIPGLQSSLTSLTTLVNDINSSLSQQITALTGQVTTLTGQVSAIQNKLSNAFADVLEILFLAGVPHTKGLTGTWDLAPSGFVQELNGDADKGLMRVTHNRGVRIRPDYFEANQAGENQAMAAGFFCGAVEPNFFEVRIEKYKPVKLMLPAGLKAAAFA
jgi:hypothetical protein